jgi:murein DD-endopeptidase MepM/ murein hydrolase activator NlpD
VGVQQILTDNGLGNPDFLSVGQVLHLPTPFPQTPSPSLKIMPDSELVYGPGSMDFDVEQEVARWQGALHDYREMVDGRERSGAEIVALVAASHSVSPRLLLAVLEYQSGWMTRTDPPPERAIYPIGFARYGSEGLYRQLMWAADELNRGYYLWRAGWAGPYILVDGIAVPPGSGINAGTVAVQHLFGQLYPVDIWRSVVGEAGFPRVYQILFGNPFTRSVEPLVPEDLTQPTLQLPFERGRSWSFTGGPHAAWGNWAAWAALDFAPPGDALGCVQSNEWVVAAADGPVIRTDYGLVVQDLDGDGLEGTGWVLQYLHVEARDRVAQGTTLQAGDRIGHPSCEGGVSSGTHLHFSRKYNGEWITADGAMPFELDGWLSSGWGTAYDGTLTQGNWILEACACRAAGNQISR